MRHSNLLAGLLLALSSMTFSVSVLAEAVTDEVAPQQRQLVESGTVDVEAESMRLILGGAKGTGMLHYQGKDYRFKLSGASVGGAGYTKVVSKGTVYNLNSIADFPGVYTGMSAGAVATDKGLGGSNWENGKGVVIVMKAQTTEGLAVNLGINAVEVELDQ